MPGRPPADLSHAEAAERNRHRIEDDRLMGVEPGHDLVRARLEGRRGERGQEPAALLLPALLVGPQHRGLRRSDRLDRSLIPLKTPEREPQRIVSLVDRRDVEGRLVAGEVGYEQADGAAALGDLLLLHELLAVLEIIIGVRGRDVPLHILESTSEWQRRIGLAILQQHEIAVAQVHVELELPGGIDPPLERWRWRAPGGDRRRECPLRGVGVGRQMDGREVEAVGHLVEAGHLAVGRQERRDLQAGQGEQVAERVFIFAPREPPQAGSSAGRDPLAVGHEQLRVEPAGHGRDLPAVWPLLVGRRHLAGGDAVVDPYE